jgi:hypothetical protein
MPTSNDNQRTIEQLIADMNRSEAERQRDNSRKLRDEILPGFKSLGVANIEVAYSGYGDSGAIDGCQYRDSAGTRVDRTTIPTSLVESLESCVYEFLPAGFEINDGGQGTLTIDVQLAKVTLQHQENYMDSRDSTREFSL